MDEYSSGLRDQNTYGMDENKLDARRKTRVPCMRSKVSVTIPDKNCCSATTSSLLLFLLNAVDVPAVRPTVKICNHKVIFALIL